MLRSTLITKRRWLFAVFRLDLLCILCIVILFEIVSFSYAGPSKGINKNFTSELSRKTFNSTPNLSRSCLWARPKLTPLELCRQPSPLTGLRWGTTLSARLSLSSCWPLTAAATCRAVSFVFSSEVSSDLLIRILSISSCLIILVEEEEMIFKLRSCSQLARLCSAGRAATFNISVKTFSDFVKPQSVLSPTVLSFLKMDACATDLISFIDSTPTPFHLVETSESLLLQSGFSKLDERELWGLNKKIVAGGKYFYQ